MKKYHALDMNIFKIKKMFFYLLHVRYSYYPSSFRIKFYFNEKR